MQDVMLPLIRKAELVRLNVNVARTGLSIGDVADLSLIGGDQIGVFARVRAYWLGLIPHHRRRMLGVLGPKASEMILPSMQHGDHLRVRIVGLTPEHLASGGTAEVYVSIWGDPARIVAERASQTPASAPAKGPDYAAQTFGAYPS